MNSTFGFMDIVIALSGTYLIYSAVKMKHTGEIGSALVGKGYDLKKAKDLQGYIGYMYPKSILMGAVVMLSGGVDYLNMAYWNIPYFTPIVCGIFLVIIVIYGKISVDAQDRFLSPKG